MAAGTINRELTRLAEAGLLKREKRGNQQLYSADTAGPIFAELASILRKTSGMADVLLRALAPVAPKLCLAFVFGSVAQGRETPGSDIDLMLIGDISFREVVELLFPVQYDAWRRGESEGVFDQRVFCKGAGRAISCRRVGQAKDILDRERP